MHISEQKDQTKSDVGHGITCAMTRRPVVSTTYTCSPVLGVGNSRMDACFTDAAHKTMMSTHAHARIQSTVVLKLHLHMCSCSVLFNVLIHKNHPKLPSKCFWERSFGHCIVVFNSGKTRTWHTIFHYRFKKLLDTNWHKEYRPPETAKCT